MLALKLILKAFVPSALWRLGHLARRRNRFDYISEDVAAAARAGRYLLLSDVPAVRKVPAFFSAQRTDDGGTVQRHPNAADLIAAIESTRMRLLREVDMGPHPHVVNAPEQPRCVGWFFQRG